MEGTYHHQIELIRDKEFLQSLNVCDYSHFINSSEFQYVYEHLLLIYKSEAIKYSIPNPVLLFSDNISLNAGAKLNNDVGIIIFNKGFVLISINEILENEKLKKFNGQFANTSKYFKISIERLIYQFTYLFTFYHEFAHLVQNNSGFMSMSEDSNTLKENILQAHYKELDADSYSSVHLARHINEYCSKVSDTLILKDVIIGISAILCSNLLYQLMRFPSADIELYYKDKTHPHSFIRILNIVANITRYINQDVNLLNYGVKISKEELLTAIVDEVTQLQKVYNNKNIKKFHVAVVENIEQITSYLKEVYKSKPSAINSALDVYNRHVDM